MDGISKIHAHKIEIKNSISNYNEKNSLLEMYLEAKKDKSKCDVSSFKNDSQRALTINVFRYLDKLYEDHIRNTEITVYTEKPIKKEPSLYEKMEKSKIVLIYDCNVKFVSSTNKPRITIDPMCKSKRKFTTSPDNDQKRTKPSNQFIKSTDPSYSQLNKSGIVAKYFPDLTINKYTDKPFKLKQSFSDLYFINTPILNEEQIQKCFMSIKEGDRLDVVIKNIYKSLHNKEITFDEGKIFDDGRYYGAIYSYEIVDKLETSKNISKDNGLKLKPRDDPNCTLIFSHNIINNLNIVKESTIIYYLRKLVGLHNLIKILYGIGNYEITIKVKIK